LKIPFKDMSNGSRGRIFTQRMAGESRPVLDKPFGTHVIESSLLDDDESNLSESSGKNKTSRMAKSVAGSLVVDINKERECLNITLLVICILLTEAISGKQVSICTVPNSAGSRRRIVECQVSENPDV